MKYVLLILLALPWPVFCQITLKGTVVDENNLPLKKATVSVLEEMRIIKFGQTNNEGRFEIELDKAGNFTLKISFLGYENHLEDFNTAHKSSFYVKMVLRTEKLEDITIKAFPKSFSLKNDTISYNLDKIKDGTERNIGDVLAKTPGLSVDENGKVSFQGNPVSKLLIDGNDFFGGQQQMATKNINPDVISSADLLLNYKDNPLEIGQGKIALNLKTNAKFRGRFTGDLTAYSGIDQKYLVHQNLFRFSEEGNLGFIGDFNNIGQTPISIQDYIELRGGISSFLPASGSQVVQLDASKMPKFLLSNSNLASKSNNYAGATFNKKLSKKLSIKSFGLFDNSFQRSETRSNRKIQELTFLEKNKSNGTLNFGMAYADLKYLLSANKLLNYSVTLNAGNDKYNQFIDYAENEQEINSHTYIRNGNFTLGQNLNFQWKINEKLNWSTSISNNIVSNKQQLNVLSDSALNYWNVTQLWQDLVDSKKQLRLNMQLTFWLRLAKINVAMSSEESKSNLSRILMQNNADALLKNNMYSWTATADFPVREKWNISFKNSLNMLVSRWNTDKEGSFYYMPGLNMVYKASNARRFSLGLYREYKFPQLENLYDFPLVTDYRSVLQNFNVLALKPTIGDHVNFSIQNFQNIMVNLSMRYGKQKNSIFRKVELTEKISFTKFMYSPSENVLAINLFLDKNFEIMPVYFKANSTFMFTKGQIFEDDLPAAFIRNNKGADVSFGSRFKSKWIQVHGNFSYTENTYSQTINNPSSRLQRLQYGTRISGKVDKWIYELAFTEHLQKSSIYKNVLHTISPEIRYQQDNWEFSLTGQNVFNLKNNQTLIATFSNIGSNETVTHILDGYAMAGVKRRF